MTKLYYANWRLQTRKEWINFYSSSFLSKKYAKEYVNELIK